MAGKKVDLRNPIFHDDDAARASPRKRSVAARSGLPALRRHGRSDHEAARQEHPAGRLQVQGLPQAVLRDGRHRHGALAYSRSRNGFLRRN